MISDFLKISPKITVLPIIHGSGDFAIEVRRVMLSERFDCLAVPLPPSFQNDVERAIGFLPGISAVMQEEGKTYGSSEWSPESAKHDEEESRTFSYVPIDPCQGVIAALRIAIQERMPRAFVDLETDDFHSYEGVFPDPYALKMTKADKFAAAVLPAIGPVPEGQPQDRVRYMAQRLLDLEKQHQSILFLCSILDWPWVKDAYFDKLECAAENDLVEPTNLYAADPASLMFLLGEMPFITGLYERARQELDDDENLSIDGIKEMVLAARDRYQTELRSRARKITPKLLSVYLSYVRNLALIERRMTPDLYTMVIAGQQIMGDQFAVHLTEVAHRYPYTDLMPFPVFKMGLGKGRLPDGDVVRLKNRLPGQSRQWRTCELKPLPPKPQQQEWNRSWNPFGQCSWPPEDQSIEKFRTHVKDVAMALLGNDLARPRNSAPASKMASTSARR